ncbi:MAG: hypothetical protein ABIQ35_11100, partial [Verrucomicrobiota bacterium]
ISSRFERATARSWRPSRATMGRVMRKIAATFLVLVVMGCLFFGCQTWKSHRRWANFDRELKRRGESLDLKPLLPGSVSDANNFARAEVFQRLATGRSSNKIEDELFGRFRSIAAESDYSHPNNNSNWTQQSFLDLQAYLQLLSPNPNSTSIQGRSNSAVALWNTLAPIEGSLAAIAKASRRPSFQIITNRDASAVYQSESRETSATLELNYVFQLRASVLLALDRAPEAAEDVLTSVRLAKLARQSPDQKSSIRAQVMLARSLQPLWEGLAKNNWTEPQLAGFQEELSAFNLLADHTNTIQRIALAYIETWRLRAEGKTDKDFARQRSGSGGGEVDPHWQPSAWWLENAMELYRIAAHEISRVDASAGRAESNFQGTDLSGITLDQDAMTVFQQNIWSAGPTLVSYAQTVVNQAIIACALERYRLAHDSFPETLMPLLGEFMVKIPNDVLRGAPMFYYRYETNKYVLRGIGPNGVIDQRIKPLSDDWIWTFAPLTTNAVPKRGAVRVIQRK